MPEVDCYTLPLKEVCLQAARGGACAEDGFVPWKQILLCAASAVESEWPALLLVGTLCIAATVVMIWVGVGLLGKVCKSEIVKFARLASRIVVSIVVP